MQNEGGDCDFATQPTWEDIYKVMSEQTYQITWNNLRKTYFTKFVQNKAQTRDYRTTLPELVKMREVWKVLNKKVQGYTQKIKFNYCDGVVGPDFAKS